MQTKQREVITKLDRISKLAGRVSKMVKAGDIPNQTQLDTLHTSIESIDDYFVGQSKAMQTTIQTKFVRG
jgi:hypothetical protein